MSEPHKIVEPIPELSKLCAKHGYKRVLEGFALELASEALKQRNHEPSRKWYMALSDLIHAAVELAYKLH